MDGKVGAGYHLKSMKASQQTKLDASCLILAGGQGRRLTPEKPLLELEGRSIIQRTVDVAASLFDEVIVVTNTPEKYEFLGVPLVADERKGRGPLMGIYSGLKQAKHDVAFVCAGDMPFLNKELIRAQYHELGDYDIVVPYPEGKPEFLHAIYRKKCLPTMRQALDADDLKIGLIAKSCKTLRLDADWFERNEFTEQMEKAFTNINTMADYRHWQGKEIRHNGTTDTLKSIAPKVLQEIRETLIDQETTYQHKTNDEAYASLWAHCSRAGRIARYIAKSEGMDQEPAMLAGLLHDMGKFAHGAYHEDDVPEERNAIEFVIRILQGTVYEKWIPRVNQAILSMYLEEEATSNLGRVVHDADNLDKLGCMGIAQFFSKNSLRKRFLDDDILPRASIELTYAYHARDTLKTETGRTLARERIILTRRFFTELLDEWAQMELGSFSIIEEDIGGIKCILVVPDACSCGRRLELETDILDAIKCRSVIVKYSCADCGRENEYSFCLPKVKGLPRK
jgi:molybdopterin-guanine dinucleotide biosynthesis protein A/HD superfamily phosphodiesterase